VNVIRRRAVVLGSAAFAAVVLTVTACIGGSYVVALNALHNHNNLSVKQACAHWGWIYQATAHDGTPVLHAAVKRTLAQLDCK